MKFYKEMDFHETPIGKIPKEWNVTKLSNLIVIETGKRAKGGALSEGSVASIGGEHIDNEGNIRWDNMKFIPEDFYYVLKQGKVTLGDVLLVKDGATTGKVAMVKKLRYEKVAVNEHVFVIRSKTNKLINEFLFYFLFSKFGQVQIKTRFHGMIGGIVRKDLETMLLPLPPHKEQQKIAEFLSVVDSVIGLVDKVIAKTERLKKGLMQTLLTRGIGHKEYKYSKELGCEVPKEWEVKKFEDVSEVRQGLQIAIGDRYKKKGQGRHVYITIQYLNNPSDERNLYYIENPKPSVVCKKDDILLTRTGNTGMVITGVEGVFHNNFFLIDYDRRIFSREFLYYYLNHEKIQKLIKIYAGSTTVPDLNHGDFYRIPVVIPSLSEQQKIADILSAVDRKLEIERKEKARLEMIKRGLMDLLLTGKIRVKVD